MSHKDNMEQGAAGRGRYRMFVPETQREGIAWGHLKTLRSYDSSLWQLGLRLCQTHPSIPASYIKQFFPAPMKHVMLSTFALNLSSPHTYLEDCKDADENSLQK